MQTEIEGKFLDIDSGGIRKNLAGIGAKVIHAERLMKRKVFDFPDDRLYEVNAWIRVRDEGDKITLSYKRLIDRSLYGTKELTLEVDNFDEACRFLEAVGLVVKSYQETRREKWMIDGVEVTIDSWPWIPTFVEIEGPDEKSVRRVSSSLGFDWSQVLHGSVETAYQKYYDVTEEEIDHCKSITFEPVPTWLAAKRRNDK